MEFKMDEFVQLVRKCAEQGEALGRMMASAGTVEPMYLYFRPSEPGKPGALFLVRDSAPVSPGLQLATGEGLRCNVPYDNYFQWVYDRSKRLPVLAF
ncbi:hypothetical protein C6571_18860 (plasmid) [Simplicispira suum]|uniref:Uncharacterized protein n=2 Tax=Simplicispira suum TaxID=2109915 RepID=A0A2S0N5T2_9BURK|nr:hypothetical protein C6571_18860 [Simplicispira suum]